MGKDVGMVVLKIDVVYECMVVYGVGDTIERRFGHLFTIHIYECVFRMYEITYLRGNRPIHINIYIHMQ
jgi:hypothetical protein